MQCCTTHTVVTQIDYRFLQNLLEALEPVSRGTGTLQAPTVACVHMAATHWLHLVQMTDTYTDQHHQQTSNKERRRSGASCRKRTYYYVPLGNTLLVLVSNQAALFMST